MNQRPDGARTRRLRLLSFWSLMSTALGICTLPTLFRGVLERGGLEGYLSVLVIAVLFGGGGLVTYLITLRKLRAGRN
jgi:hypothetical protein